MNMKAKVNIKSEKNHDERNFVILFFLLVFYSFIIK